MPMLRSGSSPSPTIDLRFGLCEIFEHAHLKFTVYGRKQASKQANKHTHARAQCSHTNVGLAQARPNYVVRLPIQPVHSFLVHIL